MSEEKVIFGLNARAVSQLTLAKIRKIYSRVDSKAIAKQVIIYNYLVLLIIIRNQLNYKICQKLFSIKLKTLI